MISRLYLSALVGAGLVPARHRATTRVAPTGAFLVVALGLAVMPARAQSAVDYYHDAAKLYIAEHNAEAEQAAEAGLALAPDDRKLQALLEKIRERNEQQQQQSGGEQEKQDEADEHQQGEGEQQDQNESGQPQPGDEGEQQQQAEGEEQSEQQPEGPADEPTNDERDGNTGQEGEPSEGTPQEGSGDADTPYDVKPGEMSRAEAERILRAIQSDELQLLRDVQRRRARPRYVEKDW